MDMSDRQMKAEEASRQTVGPGTRKMTSEHEEDSERGRGQKGPRRARTSHDPNLVSFKNVRRQFARFSSQLSANADDFYHHDAGRPPPRRALSLVAALVCHCKLLQSDASLLHFAS